jgi:hypothetical protein
MNAFLPCAAMGTSLSRIGEYSLHNATLSILGMQRREIIGVERD